MLRRTFVLGAAAAASLPCAALSAMPAMEGKNYRVIRMPSSDKLTVKVFFAYTCPHCYEYEPHVERWAAAQPRGTVVLEQIPVAWDPKNDRFTRTYYALAALGKLQELHRRFFSACIVEGRPFETDQKIENWMSDHGVEPGAWRAAFNSFAVRSQTARARQAWMMAEIEATPSTVVDSRYLSGPEMCGSNEAAIDVLDALVRKAAAQR